MEVSVYIRGWAEFATLVGIGLINLPKIWGASLAPTRLTKLTLSGMGSERKKNAHL